MRFQKKLSAFLSAVMLITLLPANIMADTVNTTDTADTANTQQTVQTVDEDMQTNTDDEENDEQEESVMEQNSFNAAGEQSELYEDESDVISEDSYNQQTVEKYGGLDALKDPQIIPDDEFFGVWDLSANEWTMQPYLDYSLDPLLEKAGEAAKLGAYDRAKEYVLSYYRQAFSTHARDMDSLALKTRRGQLSAQVAFENLIYVKNGNPIVVDKFDLTADDKQYKTDVLEDITAVIGGTNKVSYLITGLKKDGYQGVIYSKEADDESVRPYIRLNVNGSPVYVYPTQDTYISAGSNKSKIYGSEKVLRVEESRTSYGQKTSVDTNTKKAYLTFDLSDYVNSGDVLASAELFLTGHMETGSGCGNDYDTEQESASVVVWKDPQINWQENETNWNNYPEQIVFSYDGMFGPSFGTAVSGANKVEASYRDNISKYSSFMHLLARAYIYNQDDAYAYHVIRLFINAMREQSTHDPSNPRDMSDIFIAVDANYHNAGQRAKFSPEIINAIIDSKAMTPEAFTAILKNSYLLCDALAQHWGATQEGNNHGSLQIEGLCRLMLCFREFNKYSAPLANDGKPVNQYGGSYNGGWYAVAKARIKHKINIDMFSDGSSIEVSLGYVSLNMECYANLIEAVRQVGLPTEYLIEDEQFKAMENMCRYMVNGSTPTMGDWQQGHGYGHGANYRKRIQMIKDYTDDPILLWAASEGTEGSRPDYQSVVYDVGKKAVLRNSWDENAVAMQINADGGRRSHGQHDDLGLNFYAYGQHFLIDPLYFDYTMSRPQNIYLNSTRAHNTIEINGISQKGAAAAKGEAIKSGSGIIINNPSNGSSDAVMGDMHAENRELNTMYDFIRVETNSYKRNPGNAPFNGDFTEYRDLLYIKPGYTIVTDYINPSNTDENTYTQNWHFLYTTNPSFDKENNIIRSNNDGANLILAAVKQQDDFIEPEKERPALYSPGAPTVVDDKYWAFEKKVKGAVSFNTVLIPMEAGVDKTVSTENIKLDTSEDIANAFNVYVNDENAGTKSVGTYYTLLGNETDIAANKKERSFDSYTTDGRLAFAEQTDGVFTTAVMRSGSKLLSTDVNTDSKAVILSDKEIGEIGVTWSGGYMSINSSKVKSAADLGNLSIYNGGEKIKKLRLNGEDITSSLTQTANYVYFGQKLIEDNQTPSDNNNGGNGSNGTGNGHGTGGVVGGGSSSTGGGSTVTPPTATPTAQPEKPFEAELKDHWAKQEITRLVQDGIVNGMDNNSLGLKLAVSRAEFVTMLARAYQLNEAEYNGEFNDVVASDWYAPYLAAAKNVGILFGDDQGNANPKAEITREEMAKIALLSKEKLGDAQIDDSVGGAEFSDQSEISDWARGYVDNASKLGLIVGMEDGSFRPKEHVLREQAMVVVYRCLYGNK